jgi:surface polysaccharide O-acyltransferase-like enzyme
MSHVFYASQLSFNKQAFGTGQTKLISMMKPAKDLQSDVIAFLRFPLIVGVVFIHNYAPTVTIPGMEFGSTENLPVFYVCSELFTQVLGRVAVPLFFFISGFLFFLNIDGFTKQDYLKKLRSRRRTLLIPYLFWNITVLLVYCIAQSIPALDAWFNHKVSYTPQYLLESLWGGGNSMPIAYQFWFIRDLMVAVVLTPVIYFYIRKTGIYGVALLGALWFSDCLFHFIGSYGLNIVVVFFFSAGAWFGIHKRNLIEEMGKVKRWAYTLYPLLVFADLLTKQYAVNPFIHNVGIVAGIVFWINIVAHLLKTGTVGVNRVLVSAAFFVFAVHEPFMGTPIRKIIYAAFNPQSDGLITALYFLIVIVTVLIALGLYYVLRRFLPKFTALITGGR